MFGFIGIGWRTGGWSRVVSSRLPSKGYHTIRVGLVRTDASCVRPMGYLAIFCCVFSSILLASFEVFPSEGRK
jgi:hypothetical protein